MIDDWEQLMKQTPTEVSDLVPFSDALHSILPLRQHNVSRLCASGHPIATFTVLHQKMLGVHHIPCM